MRAGEVTVTGTEAVQSLLAVNGQTASSDSDNLLLIKSGNNAGDLDPEVTVNGECVCVHKKREPL